MNSQKDLIIASLEYRINNYHRDGEVQIGIGKSDAKIVVVQPHSKMPNRDAITGALKRFGMLDHAYRATSEIIELGPKFIEPPILTNMCKMARAEALGPQINRYYLIELLQIIRPLVIVTCGQEATALLLERKIRSFDRYAGKKFTIEDLPGATCYATINPRDYGYATAPRHLKDQGFKEWTKLEKIFRGLQEKFEKAKWQA